MLHFMLTILRRGRTPVRPLRKCQIPCQQKLLQFETRHKNYIEILLKRQY